MEGLSYSQRLLAEVLGTAMLVFVGVGSVPATLIVGGDAPFTMAQLGMISFAFAMIVVALIYAIGHVSGCQINPAVTVALAATGKVPWREVPGLIGAQVVGAIAGAAAIIGVLGGKAVDVGLGVASYGNGVGAGQAFFAEAVGTFILAFVVFGAIHKAAPGGFAGLAIGMAVFAAIIPVAPATGASINPARTLGPMLVQQIAGGTVHWGQLPVYLLAEFVGALAAGFIYGALVTVRSTARSIASVQQPTREGVAS
jgi:glycerol uptake facilitator protein